MAGQAGFFDGDERLKALSAAGDPLERLLRIIDFEVFRVDLEAALSRSDRVKGGRPPYDAVLMFKVLVLQTLYTLSDDQTEDQLKDRLSFMRFVGLALHDAVPDAKAIRPKMIPPYVAPPKKPVIRGVQLSVPPSPGRGFALRQPRLRCRAPPTPIGLDPVAWPLRDQRGARDNAVVPSRRQLDDM
jgi:Transposase domain (DUF772)